MITQPRRRHPPKWGRKRPRAARKPALTVTQILEWADTHFERSGRWPKQGDGRIPESAGENWSAVNLALYKGGRGLSAGSSLAQLLNMHRGVFHRSLQPKLTTAQILAWADMHFTRDGQWPSPGSGIVVDAPVESWSRIDSALFFGTRGLHGGSSLTRLLQEHRGARNRKDLFPYDVERILAWADAHQARTGEFPKDHSGPIAEAPGETWLAVDQSLNQGHRGLPGGSTLAKLLAEHRNRRNKMDLAPYSIAGILAWADAHRARTGKWPHAKCGPIADAPGETWGAVNAALQFGRRGMSGRTTLARLLAEHRGARNRANTPRLTIARILAWADLHRKQHGNFPTKESGANGESWRSVEHALLIGHRGLAGGSSLSRLLAEKRDKRNRGNLPRFTIRQILAWADAYHERHGRWPSAESGPIDGAPGESWMNGSLRGVPHGEPSSLFRLPHDKLVRKAASILVWPSTLRPRLTFRPASIARRAGLSARARPSRDERWTL